MPPERSKRPQRPPFSFTSILTIFIPAEFLTLKDHSLARADKQFVNAKLAKAEIRTPTQEWRKLFAIAELNQFDLPHI